MYSTVRPFGMPAMRWTCSSGSTWLTTGTLNASAMPAILSHGVMPPARMRSIIATEIMNPAAKASITSSARVVHCRRLTTTAAPIRFAEAAAAAYAR